MGLVKNSPSIKNTQPVHDCINFLFSILFEPKRSLHVIIPMYPFRLENIFINHLLYSFHKKEKVSFKVESSS